MKTTIKYYNVPLTVEFIVEGKFYPETRETPAEYPEIIIQSICAEDSEIDLQDMLGCPTVEEITNLIGLHF
jgi:hypothetical protein